MRLLQSITGTILHITCQSLPLSGYTYNQTHRTAMPGKDQDPHRFRNSIFDPLLSWDNRRLVAFMRS